MAFDRQFLDELIARNDIVDVVSNYVSLQPRGGSLWGCCPFHSEKTPSFHVLPDKQLCYCFGCKKGGGVINFIMEIEGLSFPEAVEFLAKRANIPLPAEDEARSNADRLRRRVLRLPLCGQVPWEINILRYANKAHQAESRSRCSGFLLRRKRDSVWEEGISWKYAEKLLTNNNFLLY